MQNKHVVSFSVDNNVYSLLFSLAEHGKMEIPALVSSIVSSYCLKELTESYKVKPRTTTIDDKSDLLIKKFKVLLDKYRIRQVDLSYIFNVSQTTISRGLAGKDNTVSRSILAYDNVEELEYQFVAKHYLNILLHSYNLYLLEVDRFKGVSGTELNKLYNLGYKKILQPNELQIVEYFIGSLYREYQEVFEVRSITDISDFLIENSSPQEIKSLANNLKSDFKQGFISLNSVLDHLKTNFEANLFF